MGERTASEGLEKNIYIYFEGFWAITTYLLAIFSRPAGGPGDLIATWKKQGFKNGSKKYGEEHLHLSLSIMAAGEQHIVIVGGGIIGTAKQRRGGQQDCNN